MVERDVVVWFCATQCSRILDEEICCGVAGVIDAVVGGDASNGECLFGNRASSDGLHQGVVGSCCAANGEACNLNALACAHVLVRKCASCAAGIERH